MLIKDGNQNTKQKYKEPEGWWRFRVKLIFKIPDTNYLTILMFNV